MLQNILNHFLPIKLSRIGNIVVFKFGSIMGKVDNTFFNHKVDDLECFVRDTYIVKLCNNKRVLHFGFLDCPITQEKITFGELLHTKISSVAKYVFGVDIDDVALSEYRKLSGDVQNCTLNILQDNVDLSLFENNYDLILLPEVLEHLPNPSRALENLKRILQLNPKSSLLVTVPNAYSKEHFAAAANGIESVHPDHYYYFSPVTLKKIITDAGFSSVEIYLYSHKAIHLKAPGITNNGVMALCRVLH